MSKLLSPWVTSLLLRRDVQLTLKSSSPLCQCRCGDGGFRAHLFINTPETTGPRAMGLACGHRGFRSRAGMGTKLSLSQQRCSAMMFTWEMKTRGLKMQGG